MMTEYVKWKCAYCGLEKRHPKANGKPGPGACSYNKNEKKHKWVKIG